MGLNLNYNINKFIIYQLVNIFNNEYKLNIIIYTKINLIMNVINHLKNRFFNRLKILPA